MSDDRGFFIRNRKKVWAFTGFLVVLGSFAGAYFLGLVPDLGFLVSPVLLAFYGVSAVIMVLGYVVYQYKTGDVSFTGSGGGAKVEDQLTKQDAKDLVEWDLYNRERPIMVGDEIRCNVKPVSNKQEGTAIRVFEWVFEGWNSGEVYCYQMSLDQEVEFDPEWIEMRTPENIERLDKAVREIINPALERKSYVDDWSERLQENREEIGQAVRDRNVVEYLDDEGNVQKREKKNVVTMQQGGNQAPEPDKEDN